MQRYWPALEKLNGKLGGWVGELGNWGEGGWGVGGWKGEWEGQASRQEVALCTHVAEQRSCKHW